MIGAAGSADRCRGVLVGLAAGDRNGGPIRMAVRLAESLIDRGRFDPADVLDRYLAWWRDGAFDTGPVTARALELIAAGTPSNDAAAQVHRECGGRTAGCNPAHRSPPLAMLACIADEDLAACATAEARLTHHDPPAGAVAAAVCRLCRALVYGTGWRDALLRCTGDATLTGQNGAGNSGGFAPDVFRAAVYFVGASPCFAEALERSLAFAGPANYCPVLVGSIGGARWGASAIPPPLLAGQVEILDRIIAAADALGAGWVECSDCSGTGIQSVAADCWRSRRAIIRMPPLCPAAYQPNAAGVKSNLLRDRPSASGGGRAGRLGNDALTGAGYRQTEAGMTEREPAGRATWEGEMFRLLAENVKDYAIFVMDPGGRVLSWSKGAERLLGFTEAEILGQQSDRFFTPEDVRRGVPRQELEQALRTGRGEDDRWHLRKDGSRFWAGGVVTPLKDGGGALRGFAKIMRDRTELKLAAEAALERERQLQLLTDRAPVLIAHCDSGQRFQFVNKPYASRFGLHPRDVVGRTIREVLGGPAYAAIEGHVRDALAGERVEFEVEVPYDGQEPQVMRCSYDPEFDDDGKVRGFVAAIVNVTQGRRMGDALRESEERLRNLSDNLPDGAVYQVVGEQDGRRQFTHVSAGVERMFGVSPAEVLADANSLYGLVHEEDRQRVAAEEEAALRGLAAFDCEFRSWTRSGDIVWLHCRSAPRRLPTGQLAWEGVVMDVTARKHAQGQLVASQRRLQSLFDNTLDAVLLADDQARYVDANPAACTLLGYGRDELLRRTVFDITPPPDAEAGRAAWENFLREGRKAGEFAVARGDGTRVVVEFRAVANVQPGLHLSVLRDVTERVQLLQQVRAERERLAEVFQQAPSFMCVLRGPDHVFERANDRYLQLVGHRELLGKPVRDAFPEIEGQGFFEMLDRVYTTGEPVAGSDMRIALVRQPGQPPEERYLDFVYQPTRDPDGAVTGILAQGVDLTERRRAQEALARLTAESERQRRLYETALSNTIDFNYTFDLDGRFTYVNKALLDLWARESHETVGKNFVELGYPPALAERLQRQIRQVIETRQPLRDETPYTSAAGEREYEYIFVPVLGAGGAVEAVAGSTRDITERKQAEQALRESEQRFARFMQHLPGLAWIKDAQGRYVYANAAAERAFRTPRARLYGKTDEEVFDPDTAARFRENDRSALAGGAGVQAVETLEQEDGLRHHSLVSKFPIPGPDGQTLVGGVAIDITDRLRAEESLREADRRKDEFLATLAHELRNPLAPIRNSLQILKLPRVDAATAERSREMMERQVHHLVRLVDDLLDVSRVMRGKIDLRKEVVELASVVARAAETAQPLIEAQRQQFTIDLPPESLPLNADPVRLAQVVGNLLTNATKYTDPGGRIALKARREGEQVVLSVRDTGIGIAPEMMPKIFDLFVQVDHAAMRSQGGLGIGLTLVKNLVEMHGGAIEARSAGLGHGSEFVVRLPLSHQERQGPGDGEPQEITHPAGRKVLVIDDNRDAADSLAMLLRLHGHEVRVAHDGPAALDVAGVYQPEVVFVDIGMPGMNGYEVARRMRQEPHLRGTVLVALTGWGQPEDRRRSAEAGFDHHMVKPAEPGALEALLAGVGRPTQ